METWRPKIWFLWTSALSSTETISLVSMFPSEQRVEVRGPSLARLPHARAQVLRSGGDQGDVRRHHRRLGPHQEVDVSELARPQQPPEVLVQGAAWVGGQLEAVHL